MQTKCTQKNVSLTYPKHRFNPEDLLDFIESTSFTHDWDGNGFDTEDDLLSLQLCIMAYPSGDELIADTGGLRTHRHRFEDDKKPSIMVYYAYFPDYGVVYLNSLDISAKSVNFTASQRRAIRKSLQPIEHELARRRIIT